jgi:hypothetical protein
VTAGNGLPLASLVGWWSKRRDLGIREPLASDGRRRAPGAAQTGDIVHIGPSGDPSRSGAATFAGLHTFAQRYLSR